MRLRPLRRSSRKPLIQLPFLDLFDHLPDVYLFVKDREHRFVRVNSSMLILHGVRTEAEMIGRTDFDFHPPAHAAQYVEEDARVMDSGRALVDQAWLVQDSDGLPQWYLSSKLPVRDARGNVCGLAGVLRPFSRGSAAPAHYDRLTAACEFVLRHYAEPIAVSDLARRANISVSQLQREFQRLFGMTPSDYLLRRPPPHGAPPACGDGQSRRRNRARLRLLRSEPLHARLPPRQRRHTARPPPPLSAA
jgi:PAS domain S-box-containing protein